MYFQHGVFFGCYLSKLTFQNILRKKTSECQTVEIQILSSADYLGKRSSLYSFWSRMGEMAWAPFLCSLPHFII